MVQLPQEQLQKCENISSLLELTRLVDTLKFSGINC